MSLSLSRGIYPSVIIYHDIHILFSVESLVAIYPITSDLQLSCYADVPCRLQVVTVTRKAALWIPRPLARLDVVHHHDQDRIVGHVSMSGILFHMDIRQCVQSWVGWGGLVVCSGQSSLWRVMSDDASGAGESGQHHYIHPAFFALRPLPIVNDGFDLSICHWVTELLLFAACFWKSIWHFVSCHLTVGWSHEVLMFCRWCSFLML